MFNRLLRPGRTRTPARGEPKRRPAFDSLEGRAMMSLGVEFPVNIKVGAEFRSADASSANGMSVAVWTDQYAPAASELRGRLFNAAGTPQNFEVAVAGSIGSIEQHPSVAMDSHGGFVVAWESLNKANKSFDIHARRFSNTGAPLGNVITVAGSGFGETDPSVAMDAAGNFVITYTLDRNATENVEVSLFNSGGGLVKTFAVTNVGLTHNASSSHVARSPDGRFDVVYLYDFSKTDTDVYLKRYSAAGSLLGTSTVAATTDLEEAPSLSIDNAGNAVVAWQQLVTGFNWDIKARRVSSTGALGSVINVQSSTQGDFSPVVALNRTTGAFAVAYRRQSFRILVTEVSANNNSVLTTSTASTSGFDPAISIGANGNYLLTYSYVPNLPSYPGQGIRARFGHV
jgi:hypothetical protein